LSATVNGEPIRVSVCHCLDCQRRTGSTFGAQARFSADSVEISGQTTEFVRVADSGNHVRFHFCPTCGSTVYYFLDADPGIVAIPIGAFADPSFPPPKFSVYESRAHAWTVLPADIDHAD